MGERRTHILWLFLQLGTGLCEEGGARLNGQHSQRAGPGGQNRHLRTSHAY